MTNARWNGGKFAEGWEGWLKERYEAAVRGAVHCVSKEINDQQAKRTYCGSEYSKETKPGTEDTRKQDK